MTWAWLPLAATDTGGAPLGGYRLYMNTGRDARDPKTIKRQRFFNGFQVISEGNMVRKRISMCAKEQELTRM